MLFSSRRRLLAASVLSLLLLTACGSKPEPEIQSPAASSDASAQEAVSSAGQSVTPEELPQVTDPVPAEPAAPQPEPRQPEPVLPPEPQPEPPAPPVEPKPYTPTEPYDFTQPAPEEEAVANDYFRDAAFVGDSRTDGFLIYSGIGGGKNLTSNGLSIFKLATKKALKIDGQDYTLLEALAREPYGKVYLSLGVNELGFYDDEGFYKSYCDAIDAIREVQPGAVIYIQGLIPVNEQRVSETLKRDYLENGHLRIYNELMQKAAREKQAVFLDLYSAFANENGTLPYDASKDGVHLNSDYCKKWLGYLQTHTVSYDAYQSGRRDGDVPVTEDPAAQSTPSQTAEAAQ